MAVKLNFEEISLDQGIDCDTLILRLSKSFCRDCERHLALLEVEVNRSEDGDNSFSSISC